MFKTKKENNDYYYFEVYLEAQSMVENGLYRELENNLIELFSNQPDCFKAIKKLCIDGLKEFKNNIEFHGADDDDIDNIVKIDPIIRIIHKIEKN